MGFYKTCLFCYTIKKSLLLPLLLLLILHSSLPQQAYMVEGTRTLNPNAIKTVKEKQVKMMMGRALIGSRPPRCERKCSNCGHCEAIQVPVVPQHQNSKVVAAAAAAAVTSHEKRRKGGHHFVNSVPRIQYSRGDGLSNYKPMSWKCKCGNLIFNP